MRFAVRKVSILLLVVLGLLFANAAIADGGTLIDCNNSNPNEVTDHAAVSGTWTFAVVDIDPDQPRGPGQLFIRTEDSLGNVRYVLSQGRPQEGDVYSIELLAGAYDVTLSAIGGKPGGCITVSFSHP